MESVSRKKPPRPVITDKAIAAKLREAKATGKSIWLADPGARGAGRFVVRCTPAGAAIYMYRYVTEDGRRDVLNLTAYEPEKKASDLQSARTKAGDWAKLKSPDLRAHFEAQQKAEKARQEAERLAAEAEARRAASGKLQGLLLAYTRTLEGRHAHADCRNVFKLHVIDAFPELADTRAADIRAEDFRDVLARLVTAGKGRSATKLRSYLRAAYGAAMRAALDPTIPAEFASFEIESNPIDRLPSLSQFNRARDRNLTGPELKAFWKRLQAMPVTAARDAITACLLLGGQRPTQLLRATAADVDVSAPTITLYDRKGRARHANPRRHVLPIVADLLPIIRRRLELCSEAQHPLFSAVNRGQGKEKRPIALREESASEIVTTICADMQTAGELERGTFSLADLRRTAETQMASMGISSDVRAQIQSHGLGGIQQRHYDRHDYMSEKTAALQRWADRLYGRDEAPKVVPLRKRAKGAA